MLKHLRESRYQYIFFQGWTRDPFHSPSVLMGLSSKLCWWCPVYLTVDDSGTRQVVVGLNTMPKHKPLPWGLFACANRRRRRWPVSPFEKTFNSGAALPSLSGCVWRGRGLGWWAGLILSVFPLQKKVVARCLDVSLCQRDSRNGDEAIGVSVPDVMCTHSWHGAVNLEESPDDQLIYMPESLLRITFGHVFSTTWIYCNIELF